MAYLLRAMKKEVRTMQDSKLKQKAREALQKGQKKKEGTPGAVAQERTGEDESAGSNVHV